MDYDKNKACYIKTEPSMYEDSQVYFACNEFGGQLANISYSFEGACINAKLEGYLWFCNYDDRG